MPEKPNRKLFPVVFKSFKRQYVFGSASELARWARSNAEFWNVQRQMLPMVADLSNVLVARLTNTAQQLATVTSKLDEPTDAVELAVLWLAIEPYVNGTAIPGDSKIAEYAASMMMQDPYGALGLLIVAAKIDKEKEVGKLIARAENTDVVLTINAGRRLLEDFEKKIRLTPDEVRNVVEEARSQMRELFNAIANERQRIDEVHKSLEKAKQANEDLELQLRSNFKNLADRLASEINAWKSELLKKTAEARSEAEVDLNALREGLRRVASDAEAEAKKIREEITAGSGRVASFLEKASADIKTGLDSITDSVRSQLQQKKPIDYWREKKKAHRQLLKWYGGAWAAAIIVFIAVPLFCADKLFEHVWDSEGHFRLWPYVVSTLYVTIGLWFLRLLAKLFFSAHHLGEDAHEREVMTDGLFSLFGEAAAAPYLTKRPYSRVIDILYRPATKGVIREEGPGLDLNRLVESVSRRGDK